MSDAWTPLTHEDHDPPLPTNREARKDAPAKTEAASAGVGFALIIPPDLIAVLSELSGSMNGVARELSENTKAIRDMILQRPGRDSTSGQ